MHFPLFFVAIASPSSLLLPLILFCLSCLKDFELGRERVNNPQVAAVVVKFMQRWREEIYIPGNVYIVSDKEKVHPQPIVLRCIVFRYSQSPLG